jgi:hypothetical protein
MLVKRLSTSFLAAGTNSDASAALFLSSTICKLTDWVVASSFAAVYGFGFARPLPIDPALHNQVLQDMHLSLQTGQSVVRLGEFVGNKSIRNRFFTYRLVLWAKLINDF